MPEKCKDCCSRLFCMSVAEVNGEDFETMANKKDCRKRVLTNADRIRSMSDEELAKEYDNRIYCGGCPVREKCDETLDLCDTLLLEWLKQPAE